MDVPSYRSDDHLAQGLGLGSFRLQLGLDQVADGFEQLSGNDEFRQKVLLCLEAIADDSHGFLAGFQDKVRVLPGVEHSFRQLKGFIFPHVRNCSYQFVFHHVISFILSAKFSVLFCLSARVVFRPQSSICLAYE